MYDLRHQSSSGSKYHSPVSRYTKSDTAVCCQCTVSRNKFFAQWRGKQVYKVTHIIMNIYLNNTFSFYILGMWWGSKKKHYQCPMKRIFDRKKTRTRITSNSLKRTRRGAKKTANKIGKPSYVSTLFHGTITIWNMVQT